MIYELVYECRQKISVSRVLKELDLSTSGYYDWIDREPSQQEIRKIGILELILKIYEDNFMIYGAPKIAAILRKNDVIISTKTVSNYMSELGIKACYLKKWIKTTVNSNFSETLKDILKRHFNPKEPDCIWVSDITYIHTSEGFVYLTSIMDLFNREIVSWDISDTLSADSVVKCINQAKQKRKSNKLLVIHSDRGIQYTCQQYLEATKGFTLSYSKKGTPWDNACIESFHALIKREWLNRYKIKDINHARTICFEYIETFYNTVRIHSTCNYESPINYKEQQLRYN